MLVNRLTRNRGDFQQRRQPARQRQPSAQPGVAAGNSFSPINARAGGASVNLSDKLTVEQWPIDRLIEYAPNPRKNDGVVDQMVGAIREFGFRIPIVAESDGSVVDGHLRLKPPANSG
jgi:hypothetical protein